MKGLRELLCRAAARMHAAAGVSAAMAPRSRHNHPKQVWLFYCPKSKGASFGLTIPTSGSLEDAQDCSHAAREADGVVELPKLAAGKQPT